MLRNMLLLLTVAAFFATSSQMSYTHEDFCPDFGNLGVKHEALVVGGVQNNSVAGGCFSKELVPNGASGDHRLNLWLGLKPKDGTFCNNTDKMDFFQFSCISSWYNDADKEKTIMFLKLYDRAARHGRLAARCAIYQKISRKTAVMRIALDDNKMCKDLGENQNNYEHMTFSLKSNWTDQPVVLFLNMRGHTLISNTVSVEKYAAHLPTVKMPKAKKSTPKLRLGEINKKMNIDETLDNIIRVRKVLEFSHIENNDKLIKSRSQDSSVHHVLTRSRRDTKGYRFPEWAQGCWVNLCINGDKAIFDTSVLYESDVDEIEDQEETDGNSEKSGNPQKVRRDISQNIKTTDDPIFPPTPPPSPPRSPPVEQIINVFKTTRRLKRAPYLGDATTLKPETTTGAFPVKFRDDNDPIDGFNPDKSEVDFETDMGDEEALLKTIKDEELLDIDILTESWNAIKARKGNDNKLPTAGEFAREAVSRGMPMIKALEKWQTVIRLNHMWESNINAHKKVPLDYHAIVKKIENYIKKRKEARAIYLKSLKIGMITGAMFPDGQHKKRNTKYVLQSLKNEWRSVTPVDVNEYIGQPENIAKLLIMDGNHVDNERYSTDNLSNLPSSPPQSPSVEQIFNLSRSTRRSKRAPCFGDATTSKPKTTTGVFPVKFRDEDDPIDGFNSGKREVDFETDMGDEEAFLKSIKDEELQDITILTDSLNAIKSRKGNDKKLSTAGDFTREAVSRGMSMTEALKKWQTVIRFNRMWESNTNAHKKVPLKYHDIIKKIENYNKKRKETRPIYLKSMKTGVMTDAMFPEGRRKKRSTKHVLRSSKTEWRNVMPVDIDENNGQPENIAKFLIIGGNHVGDERYPTGDTSYLNNENKSDPLINIAVEESLMYGCMWIVRRDRNIIEYAVLIAKNVPNPDQPLLSFARDLCAVNKTVASNSDVKSHLSPRPHRQRWITETRNNVSDRVLVSCPVLPGTVYYGKLPPSPAAPIAVDDVTVSAAGASNEPSPAYCVRLISSVDDVASGREGLSDRMKYTVSECIDPTSLTGISSQPMNSQVTNEAGRGYTGNRGGIWRRTKRQTKSAQLVSEETSSVSSTHDDRPPTSTTSTPWSVTTTVSTVSTAPLTSTDRSTVTTSATKSGLPTTVMTTTVPRTTTTSGITFTSPRTIADSRSTDSNSTVTTTGSTTGTVVPPSQDHQQTPPFIPPSPLTSSTTSTATTIISTTAWVYQPTTDDQQQHRQQWQSQPNNNDGYYNRGRQQYYPLPPPVSNSTDFNYYYRQRQQQQLPQWPSQPQPQWPRQPQWQPTPPPQQQSQWYSSPPPQQQSQWYSSPPPRHGYNNNNNGGHQQPTVISDGRRTDNHYYRQQQQNYHNQLYNQQQTTPMMFGAGGSWRNASSQQPYMGGGWNVHGDRPMYVSSGSGSDTPLLLLNTTNSNSNDGGWTTAAQQHWWYRQQQQQQQNSRVGAGGILSLRPVPLPPLNADQTIVTVSGPLPSPSSFPLYSRRPQKPTDHYYQPTPSTAPIFQPNRLQSKSDSRHYQEREYKCLGQWSEDRQIGASDDATHSKLTYMYVQRLDRPNSDGMPEYECYVVTSIPNQPGQDPRATTLLLTEAGKGTHCSRLADPYVDGMKLVGTKINNQGTMSAGGKSWFPLKPQQINPENGERKWYASPPVPMSGQNPTTMTPIVTGRHTGGNGALHTPRQHQTRRPPMSPPTQTNIGFRTVRDPTIVGLLILITISLW